jgi:hypothetical protein
VKNTKRERAKSRVVEEIKAVLEVENKVVVTSSYGLTRAGGGRGDGGVISTSVHRPTFCGIPTSVHPSPAPHSIVLAKFERKEFVQIRKYRGATKRWHRGGFRNIVKQQKMASR